VVGDIDQPKCPKCTKNKKKRRERERRKTTCDIVVNQCHQPQCHPGVIPNYLLFLYMKLYMFHTKRVAQRCKNSALYPNSFAHFESKCPKYPYAC